MNNEIDNVIKCRNGWQKLYEPILETIIRHDKISNPDERIGIKSIESDCGVLEVNLGNPKNTPSHIRTLINENKVKSMDTCEFCGCTTDIGYTTRNDITTCCNRCFNLYLKKTHGDSWFKKNNK